MNKKLKTNKIFEKLMNSFVYFTQYFLIPFVVLGFISVIIKTYVGIEYGGIVDSIVGILLLFFIIYSCKKVSSNIVKDKSMIWIVSIAFAMSIISIIISYVPNILISNVCIIISLVLYDILLLYYCINSCLVSKINISKIVLSALGFLMVGYFTIYISSYGFENNIIFNSLIGLFSAIVGGGITLAGVAWTIKKSDMNKKAEAEMKAKPVFSFNRVIKEVFIKDDDKACFPLYLDQRYVIQVNFVIENSNRSFFTITRIMHDGKWFEMQGQRVVLPNSKVLLNFEFNEPKDIYLEVEDELFKKHYYNIQVLSVGVKTTSNNQVEFPHTVRAIEEVCEEKIKSLHNKQN